MPGGLLPRVSRRERGMLSVPASKGIPVDDQENVPTTLLRSVRLFADEQVPV
jgi:hypothetical protein